MGSFHILNGDSLKSQFPTGLTGGIIVLRECLIDGDVNGSSIDELIESRIVSMREMYGTPKEEYLQKVVPEFQKISKIEVGEVHLWFEDDLFCQVNFWFTCSLLEEKSVSVDLIRPTGSLRYGFGGMSQQDLTKAFSDRQPITSEQIKLFAQLWRAYQNKDMGRLADHSSQLTEVFPFLQNAVQAQIDRMPTGNGLPERTLKEIIAELDNQDFGSVFKEFSNRLPIYGFGDLQVKRLFDQLQQE